MVTVSPRSRCWPASRCSTRSSFFNNLTDFDSNISVRAPRAFPGHHFPGNQCMYRALKSLDHVTFYCSIICWEAVTGLSLCGALPGSFAPCSPAVDFNAAKTRADDRAYLSLLMWLVPF